jgi:hypothetical protein
MAGYFAELQNNIVQRVVSATEAQWCVDNLGGEWVQTYYSTEGKNYAGIGHTYDPVADNFIAPQPYPSWILGTDLKWAAPVLKPTDENFYIWSEENLMWVIV